MKRLLLLLFALISPFSLLSQVDLSINKVVNNPVPNVGSDVVFTITVENKDLVFNATGVSVSDILPDGYTFVSDDGGGNFNSVTGHWSIGTFAAGASSQLNITCSVKATGNYSNSATVTSDNDTNPSNDSATATVTPVPQADLSVNKVAGTNTPNVGSNVTFTITVNNSGPSTATGVSVTDNLPSGYTFVSATPSVGSWASPTWTVGDMAPGSSATLTLVATVLSGGAYNNSATVASATADPVAGNNTSLVTVTPVPQADLEITKTISILNPKIGDEIKFTLTVTNKGPSNSTGVKVSDPLPSGYTYKSFSGDGSYVSGTGLWTIGNIAKDAVKSIEIIATVVLSANYSNVATVSAVENDPNPANNQDSATPVIQNSAPVAVNNSYSTPEDITLNVNSASGLLSNDYDVDGDVISVTMFNVNSTNYNAGQTANLSQGNLTISSNGSISFSPVLNYNGVLPVITYTVSDTKTTSNATLTITVNAVNDPPTAVTDSYVAIEDTPLNINAADGLLKNDSDIDGDNISVIQFTVNSTNYTSGQTANFTQGSLTVLSNGSFSFIPALNFNGLVTGITYTISDGALTSTAGIGMSVTAVNDAPVANPDYLYTAEGTGTIINVLANDNDAADGPSGGLSLSSLKITKQPTNGSIIILANKTISYTPHTGFYGQDVANYEICDVGYPLPPICVTGTIYIDVARVSPQAVDDNTVTNEDTPVNVNVLQNDIDTDIDPSSLVIVSAPTKGTISYLGNGIVRYTPNHNYNGGDSFNYTVRDLTNLISNIGKVTITINPVPDTPVSTNGWYSTPENVQVLIPLSNLVTDPDGDIDFSTILIAGPPQNGIITLGSNPGDLIYTPNFGYAGNDSFKYNVSDATGLRSNTSTISVQVSDQAPSAVDDVISINEDETVAINVLSNDTDPQNNIDPTSVTIVTQPKKGVATVNTQIGRINYTPNANYFGNDTFDYRVCDLSSYCDEGRVTITILPVNDAPVAVNDVRVLQEDNSVFIDVLANDFDVDNLISELVITIVSQPVNGVVQVVKNPGGIVYSPKLNYNGPDSFFYRLTDQGGLSSTATVNLNVTPVNDPPQPANDNFTPVRSEGMILTILANDTDPENNINPASVTIITQPQHGHATVNANGTVFYLPNATYFGSDGFTYSVCDTDGACAQAQVTLWVIAGNGPPQPGNDSIFTNEDILIQFNPLINDTDPNNNINPASILTTEGPFFGTIEIINSMGEIIYKPNLNYFGNDYFKYRICDSGEPPLCSGATVYITINSINDAPGLQSDVINMTDMAVANANVLINDTEVEGEIMTSTLISASPSVYGEFSLTANGSFIYNSYPGSYCNTDVITYKVCDPLIACSQSQIVVNISPKDSDSDRLPDFIETVTRDTNSDNVFDYLSSDSDGDGISDLEESGITDTCLDDTPRDTDGDGVPDYRDLDSDDDGVPDRDERTGDCDNDGLPNYIDDFDDCGDRLNVPSTFSPNGDGVNEFWIIQGVKDFRNNELSVFNRWGSLVFHQKPYDNNWNGKASTNVMGADDLPEGTYYYVLVLDNKNFLKGSVYIKR